MEIVLVWSIILFTFNCSSPFNRDKDECIEQVAAAEKNFLKNYGFVSKEDDENIDVIVYEAGKQ